MDLCSCEVCAGNTFLRQRKHDYQLKMPHLSVHWEENDSRLCSSKNILLNALSATDSHAICAIFCSVQGHDANASEKSQSKISED